MDCCKTVVAVFQATYKGWIDIMNYAIDARGVSFTFDVIDWYICIKVRV